MPLSTTIISENKFTIGIWEITETIDELINKIKLSEEESELFCSFGSELRKLHWLSYRCILSELFDSTDTLFINYDKNGKPYLKNKDYHISVSHSGIYSAAIISKNLSVGIDIENISPRIDNLYTKFLNKDEISVYQNIKSRELLYIYWGAKESVFKSYGKGSIIFNENIFIKDIDLKFKKAKAELNINNSIAESYDIFFELINNYMLVYSISSKNNDLK